MSPGTEFARDFCAGIGPLKLGVVLVSFIFNTIQVFTSYQYFSQVPVYIILFAIVVIFFCNIHRYFWNDGGGGRPDHVV